jgi:probable rRNA maturation factor
MAEPGPSPSGTGTRAPLAVETLRQSTLWDASSVRDAMLTRVAAAAFAAAGPRHPRPCAVTLVLADDATVRALNRQWRGKDAPTNVLSFPAGIDAEHWSAPECEPRPLGDVVLAFETIAREASAAGIALTDHAAHLVVHGVLHLLGFEHEDETEAEEMESIERRVLAQFGVADPYAETNGPAVAEASP